MQCYNSKCADQHAHEQGQLAEKQNTLDNAFESLIYSRLPESIVDVITGHMGSNQEFAAAMERAVEQLISGD